MSSRETPIRVLLIMPDAQMHKLRVGSFVRSAREAPISLTTLAALTRARDDVTYRIVDESVDRVPFDGDFDLVGVSVLTGTSRRAYALADHFRRRGLPVVLGGIHVTLMPDEAAQFADAIVIGMAERLWPRVLEDFAAGRLAARYSDPTEPGPYVEDLPTPMWHLQRTSGYMVPYVVQATRGCKHACDFCTVPAVWSRFQRRPVADVVRDIAAVPSKRFVISDVSPFDDRQYAKELLRAMIPLGKKWGGLATTTVAQDPELMDLLRRSGCQYLLLGFESAEQSSLNTIYKGFNRAQSYAEVMRAMHDAGIIVQGCFVFGFDEDDESVFARTVALVDELKVDIPRYSIYTPYPGTRLFERLEAEGRILSYDWSTYDTMHVVHRPMRMSPAALFEGFRNAYRDTFRIRSIVQRTLSASSRFPIAFMGNLTYRIFVRRLQQSRGFEMPLPHAGKPTVVCRAARSAQVEVEAETAAPEARLPAVGS